MRIRVPVDTVVFSSNAPPFGVRTHSSLMDAGESVAETGTARRLGERRCPSAPPMRARMASMVCQYSSISDAPRQPGLLKIRELHRHHCGQCARGCVSGSNFSSSQVLIPPAQATGRLTLITNAIAREIVVGKDGKAEAVSYIDRTTKMEKRVHSRSFVLAASTCESARLLLNSRSALFPEGLANSSGGSDDPRCNQAGNTWRVTGESLFSTKLRPQQLTYTIAVSCFWFGMGIHRFCDPSFCPAGSNPIRM